MSNKYTGTITFHAIRESFIVLHNNLKYYKQYNIILRYIIRLYEQ